MTTARTKTTPRKTTTRKTTTSTKATKPKATARTAAPRKRAAPKVEPVVVAAEPVVAGPMLRKKELIDAVVAQSGVKTKDAKPVVEAMLSVLGDALRDGRELNLQPLGKLMVRRSKKIQNGTVLTAQLRQKDEETPASTDPLKTAAE